MNFSEHLKPFILSAGFEHGCAVPASGCNLKSFSLVNEMRQFHHGEMKAELYPSAIANINFTDPGEKNIRTDIIDLRIAFANMRLTVNCQTLLWQTKTINVFINVFSLSVTLHLDSLFNDKSADYFTLQVNYNLFPEREYYEDVKAVQGASYSYFTRLFRSAGGRQIFKNMFLSSFAYQYFVECCHTKVLLGPPTVIVIPQNQAQDQPYLLWMHNNQGAAASGKPNPALLPTAIPNKPAAFFWSSVYKKHHIYQSISNSVFTNNNGINIHVGEYKPNPSLPVPLPISVKSLLLKKNISTVNPPEDVHKFYRLYNNEESYVPVILSPDEMKAEVVVDRLLRSLFPYYRPTYVLELGGDVQSGIEKTRRYSLPLPGEEIDLYREEGIFYLSIGGVKHYRSSTFSVTQQPVYDLIYAVSLQHFAIGAIFNTQSSVATDSLTVSFSLLEKKCVAACQHIEWNFYALGGSKITLLSTFTALSVKSDGNATLFNNAKIYFEIDLNKLYLERDDTQWLSVYSKISDDPSTLILATLLSEEIVKVFKERKNALKTIFIANNKYFDEFIHAVPGNSIRFNTVLNKQDFMKSYVMIAHMIDYRLCPDEASFDLPLKAADTVSHPDFFMYMSPYYYMKNGFYNSLKKQGFNEAEILNSGRVVYTDRVVPLDKNDPNFKNLPNLEKVELTSVKVHFGETGVSIETKLHLKFDEKDTALLIFSEEKITEYDVETHYFYDLYFDPVKGISSRELVHLRQGTCQTTREEFITSWEVASFIKKHVNLPFLVGTVLPIVLMSLISISSFGWGIVVSAVVFSVCEVVADQIAADQEKDRTEKEIAFLKEIQSLTLHLEKFLPFQFNDSRKIELKNLYISSGTVFSGQIK